MTAFDLLALAVVCAGVAFLVALLVNAIAARLAP